MRPDARQNDELRPVRIIPRYIEHAEGSVFVEMGNTHVICTASLEEQVPPHLKGSATGWITAEYAMLPRATAQRTKRERGTHLGGRTQEIQRLVGRSLRSVADLSALGERTIVVDCDVIKADGGSRTASITGAFLALAQAVEKLKGQMGIRKNVLRQFLAAVSVGIVDGETRLDLCYEEDSSASVDMNVIMVESGDFVEIQATGEEATFSRGQTGQLLDLAWKGIRNLIAIQKTILPSLP
jgi:ribonuclease PH